MILIINNHSKNVPFFKRFLEEEGIPYRVHDRSSALSSFQGVSGVILSGGKTLSENVSFKEVRADIASLLYQHVPVLGVCAGHQVMAQAFGGVVGHLKKPSLKEQRIHFIKPSPLFKGLPKSVAMYEHHYRYVKVLPEGFRVIASSSKDRIEGMQHERLPFYGLQFHPEKSGRYGKKILKNFIQLCGFE